ncbi:pectinesterase family protein [Sphingomonas pituitosa]|uniref:pectinesterase family protein n=1 Tax=Sphingomonas pituitosa TaxID=99597 RepID=UPI000A55409A|nr:pectinesterase family protein [Sphingomonas pituitosa]
MLWLVAALVLGAPGPAAARNAVRVSLRAPGAFPSIQQAIDALPATGGVVRVDAGIWREKVRIEKPHVTLAGVGRDPAAVVLVHGDSSRTAGGTVKSATLTVTGDDFHAGNLTIRNDWGSDPANPPSQAVALALTGDRAVLDRVRLLGHQDTLYANKGPGNRMARHYFSRCYVEGHVDFIFGNANAYFRDCRLHGVAHAGVMYTAQSRNAPDEDSAYVFDRCRLTADPAASDISLGRAWRPYARVLFLRTRMDAAIIPEGWREWTPGKTDTFRTAYYAEFRSTGPGGDPRRRVPSSHQLSAAEAKQWRYQRLFGDTAPWVKQALVELQAATRPL